MLTMLRSNSTFLPPLHSERARRTTINDDVEIVLLLSSAFNISVVVAKQFSPSEIPALFTACPRGVSVEEG